MLQKGGLFFKTRGVKKDSVGGAHSKRNKETSQKGRKPPEKAGKMWVFLSSWVETIKKAKKTSLTSCGKRRGLKQCQKRRRRLKRGDAWGTLWAGNIDQNLAKELG